MREHIELFCADTQPAELQALREAALLWMGRLAEFRPHVSGAVWRGTATRLSSVHLDLYCDDPKAAEIALVNAGVHYDVGSLNRPGREPLSVLTVSERSLALGEHVTLHLMLHDLDDQRGALKPSIERILHSLAVKIVEQDQNGDGPVKGDLNGAVSASLFHG